MTPLSLLDEIQEHLAGASEEDPKVILIEIRKDGKVLAHGTMEEVEFLLDHILSDMDIEGFIAFSDGTKSRRIIEEGWGKWVPSLT